MQIEHLGVPGRTEAVGSYVFAFEFRPVKPVFLNAEDQLPMLGGVSHD